MRRRLWWQICLLDHRSLSNSGTEGFVDRQQYTTDLPANIHDEDIHENSTHLPPPVRGITNATVAINRCYIHLCFAKVHTIFDECRHLHAHAGPPPCDVDRARIDTAIAEFEHDMHDKFLQYLDEQIPYHAFLNTVSRLVTTKIKRFVARPSASLQDRLSVIDMDLFVIESTISLYSSPLGRKWVWCYGSYVQWRAIATVLKEVQRGGLSEEVEQRVFARVDSLLALYRAMALDRSSRSILSALCTSFSLPCLFGSKLTCIPPARLRNRLAKNDEHTNGVTPTDALVDFDFLQLDQSVLSSMGENGPAFPEMQEFLDFDWLAS